VGVGVFGWRGSGVDFKTVAAQGGIDLGGPCVDPASQAEGFLEAVPAEPCDLVEHVRAAVVIKQDRRVRIAGEELLLEFLGEEPRSGNDDGFVLLPGAEVHERQFGDARRGGGGFHEQGAIMLVAGEKVGENLVGVEIAALAEFGEGFGVGEGAALAAAEVVRGEKRAFGPGKGLHDGPHRGVGGDFGNFHTASLAPLGGLAHRDFPLFPNRGEWLRVRRMPREREPDEVKIYFLPNLMTAGNLACGFFAVLMIFAGLIEVAGAGPGKLTAKEYYEISHRYYEYAILLIFGSCLFDLLDGRLARMGGQDSPFGREFDSLADIISFGMAPAMLLSRAVLYPLGKVGWAIALIYLVCGAMRLAKFNCLAAMPKRSGASSDFRGLPIPMAAGFIASLTFLLIDLYKNDHDLTQSFWKYVLAGAMLGLSLLMISDIRYPSFKKVGLRTRGTLGAIVVTLIIAYVTFQFRYIMPVVLFSLYLLYGMIRPLISQRMRKEIEVDAEPDEEPAAVEEGKP
jgi:CDP-diacylglycerol--serine O-phosphatidyltransferase